MGDDAFWAVVGILVFFIAWVGLIEAEDEEK